MTTLIKPRRGRPTLYAPAAVDLAASGLPLVQVAARLGVTPRVLTNWIGRYPEFRAAVSRGRERRQLSAERGRIYRQTSIAVNRAAAIMALLREAGFFSRDWLNDA